MTAEPLTASSPPIPTAPAATAHWVFLGLALAVLLGSFVLQVKGDQHVGLPGWDLNLPPSCTYRSVMGIECPGCGLTRCFVSLAHGDLAAAWRYNPAGLLLFVLVVVQVPYRSWQIWRIRSGRGEARCPRLVSWLLVVLAVAMVLQWLGRVWWPTMT